MGCLFVPPRILAVTWDAYFALYFLGLNDSSCQSMCKSLPYLRKLDMSWNSSLTDEALFSLFHSCPLLIDVKVAGLKRITAKPFLPIISELSRWRIVRERIRNRLQMQMGNINRGRLIKDFTEYEVNEEKSL